MTFLEKLLASIISSIVLLSFVCIGFSQNAPNKWAIVSVIGTYNIIEELNYSSITKSRVNIEISKQIDSTVIDTTLKINTIPENIITTAKQYLGTSYRRGAKGPNNFDCSGFTSYIYQMYGYSLGASCTDQITEGKRIEKDELKAGDLIFFKGRKIKSTRAGHVGIVISNEGNGDIKFIHASCNKGITIDMLSRSDYYKYRYITGLRILPENTDK